MTASPYTTTHCRDGNGPYPPLPGPGNHLSADNPADPNVRPIFKKSNCLTRRGSDETWNSGSTERNGDIPFRREALKCSIKCY